MAKQKKPHHNVVFAARYSTTYFRTFVAASAVNRAQALIDDATALQQLRDKCEKAKIEFGSYFNRFEVVPYYAVGLVTCLEWHARSRLTDLMVYRPECIADSDAKIDKVVLSQLMSEQATVPYLLGAATKISSVDAYIGVFERLFKALGTRSGAETILRTQKITKKVEGEADAEYSLYDILVELFETRHHLVHEIDLGIVGHFSLRDMWDVDRPVWFGAAVLASIKAMEAEITRSAPEDFPNRLDKDGEPEDEEAKLADDIAGLEKELSEGIKEREDKDTLAAWSAAVKASTTAVEKEAAFLQKAEFLRPVRHLDCSEAIKKELLKRRKDYLQILLDELNAYGDKDDVNDDATKNITTLG